MIRRLALYVILLAATAGWVTVLRARQAATASAAALDRIPLRIGSRAAVDLTLDERLLRELRADRALSRLYIPPEGSPAEMIQLFVAYFGSQKTGAQIHSPQNCLPASGWKIRGRSKWRIETPYGPRAVNEFLIVKGQSQQIVHYWFLTRSGIVDNEFALKWDLVWNSLLGRPTDAALVRLVVPVPREGTDAARLALREFNDRFRPELARAIPIAPAGGPRAARAI